MRCYATGGDRSALSFICVSVVVVSRGNPTEGLQRGVAIRYIMQCNTCLFGVHLYVHTFFLSALSVVTFLHDRC